MEGVEEDASKEGVEETVSEEPEHTTIKREAVLYLDRQGNYSISTDEVHIYLLFFLTFFYKEAVMRNIILCNAMSEDMQVIIIIYFFINGF